MAEPLWRLGAGEIAGRVRGGELPAAAVVDACLARIGEVEPRIGAFRAVFSEAARARAAAVDRRVAAGGDPGPLAGVPVAVKDNQSLAGEPLTCGSRIHDGYRAPFTATAVERLE
jgi:Asp-tRNA(Asn)/Glu-tRNA(Gln) amidotransferase A subunit family amidase